MSILADQLLAQYLEIAATTLTEEQRAALGALVHRWIEATRSQPSDEGERARNALIEELRELGAELTTDTGAVRKGAPLATEPGLAEPPLDHALLDRLADTYPESGVAGRDFAVRGESTPATGGEAAAAVPVARYFEARGPDRVLLGATIPIGVRVAIEQPASGNVVPFELDVPDGGIELSVLIYANGFAIQSSPRLPLRVPRAATSDSVYFELTALTEGSHSVVFTLLHPLGRQLAELTVPVYVGPEVSSYRTQEVRAGASRLAAQEGEITLLVDWLEAFKQYRFQFIHRGNPPEVLTEPFQQAPAAIVATLIDDLNSVAKAEQTPSDLRSWLMERGVTLWSEMLPDALKSQYFEIRDKVTSISIVSRNDPVPWELLYPLTPQYDEGFLIEQLPVFRGLRGLNPTSRVGAGPLVTVVPADGAPPAALTEKARVQAHWPADAAIAHVNTLPQLQDVLTRGDVGVVHFACHNQHDFGDAARAAMMFGPDKFTPTTLAPIVAKKTLSATRPLVFINACHTAGQAPSYTEFAGWASKFMEAGAGAFLGSLWKVRDRSALDFADAFYSKLRSGATLGTAVTEARDEIRDTADPTWLAYTAYGDVNATLVTA